MVWYNIVIGLCARIFLMLIFFSLLCRTSLIRKALTTLKERRRSRILLIGMFSAMALVDIWVGTQMPAYFLNNHLVMTVAAGIIGGPVIGLGTSLLSSAIAYAFMPVAFATYHYPLMVAFGLASGCLAAWLQRQNFIFLQFMLLKI